MSIEEYYHVFETILFAAVLTLIVQGWSKMILYKSDYEMYWPYLIGSISFAVAVVWRYFIFRSFTLYSVIDTPFEFLILVFIPAASLLLGANIYFPDHYRNFDIKKHLTQNAFWIGMQQNIFCIILLYHFHLAVGLNMILILAATGPIILWTAFMITRNLKIFEILTIGGLIVIGVFLFQDSSFYGL